MSFIVIQFSCFICSYARLVLGINLSEPEEDHTKIGSRLKFCCILEREQGVVIHLNNDGFLS